MQMQPFREHTLYLLLQYISRQWIEQLFCLMQHERIQFAKGHLLYLHDSNVRETFQCSEHGIWWKWVRWQVPWCHVRDMLGNLVTFYIQLIKKKLQSVLRSLVRHQNSGFYTWIAWLLLKQVFPLIFLTLLMLESKNVYRWPPFFTVNTEAEPSREAEGRDNEKVQQCCEMW